jgi:hypothetical protein
MKKEAKALQKEHTALQIMKFRHGFVGGGGDFASVDTDFDTASKSGSSDPI